MTSSAAAATFPALAGLIFAAPADAGNQSQPAPQSDADGDDSGAQGANDHDADDMPASPQPQISDAGTYDFGGATA